MKIAVDLRLLNYQYITGIGAYTIRLLEQLWLIKQQKEYDRVQIYAIGLKEDRLRKLQRRFAFLQELFTQSIDLPSYLGKMSIKNYKLLQVQIIFQAVFFEKVFDSRLIKFDYIILPQPRLLPAHPETKIITIFHDLYALIERANFHFIQKMLDNPRIYKILARVSSQIWGVSLTTCYDIESYLKADKTKIKLAYSSLPKLKDLEKQFSSLDSEEIKLPNNYILAISGIEPRKNWYNLLLAHKLLQMQYSEYDSELVFLGKLINEDYYNQLIALIKKLNIKNVTWMLNVSENNKEKLLSESKFVVYPSFYEGFGFPILEAFSFGKPVITSKISSMPEVAKDSALYINPLNFKDIAAAIYVLLNDEKIYQLLKSKTKANLEAFSWSELNTRLKSLLSYKV
ncbi:MAG: glycosyltransferase family 1 protein [Patescibacteria group bacterium]